MLGYKQRHQFWDVLNFNVGLFVNKRGYHSIWRSRSLVNMPAVCRAIVDRTGFMI